MLLFLMFFLKLLIDFDKVLTNFVHVFILVLQIVHEIEVLLHSLNPLLKIAVSQGIRLAAITLLQSLRDKLFPLRKLSQEHGLLEVFQELRSILALFTGEEGLLALIELGEGNVLEFEWLVGAVEQGLALLELSFIFGNATRSEKHIQILVYIAVHQLDSIYLLSIIFELILPLEETGLERDIRLLLFIDFIHVTETQIERLILDALELVLE